MRRAPRWTFGNALYPAGNYKGMANLKWTCSAPCVSRNYLIQVPLACRAPVTCGLAVCCQTRPACRRVAQSRFSTFWQRSKSGMRPVLFTYCPY